MAQDRIIFPTPTFEQGIQASMRLAEVYGRVKVDVLDEEKPRTPEEAAQKLEGLAVGIIRGTVTSHREIAVGVKSLEGRIGPFGGYSQEVDAAAFKLVYALRNNYPRIQDANLITPPPGPERR